MRHDLRNFTTIPEIDLSTFDAGAGTRSLFLDHLRTPAHEGFFYLAGQRINPHLLRRLMDRTRRFLALPYEEKMAIKLPAQARRP